MIGNFDNIWLLFSILVTSSVTLVFFILQKNRFDKFFILFFNFTMFVYSGYGIAGNNIENRFYVYFYAFILFFNLSYTLMSKWMIKRSETKSDNNKFDIFIRNSTMLKITITIFLITLFLPLIVPNFRLFELINPPSSSTQQIFEKRLISNTNTILYFGKTVQLLLLPFFFIYLKKCIDLGKNFYCLILYLLFVYLKFLEYGYLARHEIVGYFCLFITILMSVKSFKKFKIIFFASTIIMLLLSVPFFVQYQESRIGGIVTHSTYFGYFNKLIASEGFYPIYYNQIIRMNNLISPFGYFLWLIFLVIPTKVLPLKPTLAINEVFTYQVTGLRYGDYLYSIQLPSLLGESMMIYGTYFFWIHAIFLGSFSAVVFTFYKKHPTLKFWLIYLAISFIKIPRGGSQGFISEALNGSVGLFIAFLLYIFIKSWRWRNNA
ncbi:oligosaccharide repeat unit polymerase [Enterococcus faecium]|nr:oligosaccharide repeat unit polymerase [Enterococcus faecium]